VEKEEKEDFCQKRGRKEEFLEKKRKRREKRRSGLPELLYLSIDG
jgi:hypothetical protein